jgi:DNA invertase Pin-like site-specific DNA recombinase
METKFVSYCRLSTKERAGKSSWGLQAQQDAVERYVRSVSGEVVASFSERETATGKKHRPVLQQALDECKARSAVLVVAKIDRLTRNIAFLSKLEESGVQFVSADNPMASSLTVGILALVGQEEAKTIQKRIREGLSAAKARGVRLGAPPESRQKSLQRARKEKKERADEFSRGLIKEVISIEERSRKKPTLQGLADRLNREGFRTRRGKMFYPKSVSLLKQRAESLGLY